MGSRVYVEFEDDPKVGYDDDYYDSVFKATGKSTDSSLSTSGDVVNEHNWPIELEQKCPDWTEAFKGWPLRKTVGRPTRLFHIQSGEVVHPEQPVQYAAVSYVWSQWGKVEDILCRLKGVMKETTLEYCWIDQLCIKQNSEKDKEDEIRRMKKYYADAAVTYVMVPEWTARFTWEVAGFSMRDEQTAIAATEVSALKKTMWASRVWTFQEASLSGRTVFVGSSVVKSATELAVAIALDQIRDQRFGCKNCSKLENLMRKRPIGGRGDCTCVRRHGLVHAVWRRRKNGSTNVGVASSNFPACAVSTHLLRDKVILTYTGSAETEYEYLDEIWRRSGDRHCKEEEDRVYGMLGLVRRGSTVTVEYGIGFEEAVKRAAEKGLVSQGVLLAATKSTKPGRSWYPAPGTEGQYRKSKWAEAFDGVFKTLRLNDNGLWMVQGAKCRPCDPESIELPHARFLFENGGEYLICFTYDVPQNIGWQGDWLVVMEGPFGLKYVEATLIKYEMGEDGRPVKLEVLGVNIEKPSPHGNDAITANEIATRDFLLS